MKNKLFKWIGGKSWLSNELNLSVDTFKNKNIDTYIEPFSGGLGSFVCLLDNLKSIGVKNFHLNDVNSALINTYNQIKSNPIELTEIYFKIEDDYIKCIPEKTYSINRTKNKNEYKNLLSSANDFYKLNKDIFNQFKYENSIYSAALFLFLTNHNFNGIYRENSKGLFNVSYNWEIRKICKKSKSETILYYSNLFNDNNILFYNEDCFAFMNRFSNNSNCLFYLDPPYINLNKKENSYSKDGFQMKEQLLLLSEIKKLNFFIFSNHNHDIFLNEFKSKKYKIKKVYRRNTVSQNKDTRKKMIEELIVIKNK